MKRVLIIAILTLLAISSGFADGYPAEEAEHWEKVRQLEQLADRFKAETGFTGSIESSTERMRLSYFDGRFADIQIAADADTASYRAAFEQILDKVLPYTFAKREQLIRSRITRNLGRIETEFYQQVNGYRVEGIGRLIIAYDSGRYGFVIGNGTVVLPETDALPTLSYKDAVQIAKSYYVEELGYSEDVMITPKTHSITFVDIDGHYELCYVLGIPDPSRTNHEDYTIVINAITGRVKRLWNESRPVNFHVTE